MSVSWPNRSSAGSQIRNHAGRRSRRWIPGLGSSRRVARVPRSPSICAAPDLVTRVSSETEKGLTPTTRVVPPDPGHRDHADSSVLASVDNSTHWTATCRVHGQHPDRHQTTDLAVGGSNPSRRATITAAQRPSPGAAAAVRLAGVRLDCHHVGGQPRRDCDHLRPRSPLPTRPGHFRVRAPLPAPSAATALALPAARFDPEPPSVAAHVGRSAARPRKRSAALGGP